jgi:phospholipase C
MTSQSRRDFIRAAAQAAAASAAMGVIPAGIRQALALPANNTHGNINDIEHIVILMQENRSFDHYFGTLRGVRGYGDTRTITLPSGQSVWHQPGLANVGEVLPFRPDVPNLGLQFVQDLAHDWTTTHQAWNGGRYNQWVPAKGTTTMAYYTRQDIPFHYQLADAFTICDGYHCSIMAPTDPNRYYMWTGWVGNDGNGGGPVIDNSEAGYSWGTYPEILENAGVSWKIYQDAGLGLDSTGVWGYTSNPYIGNFGDNSLLYFDQYRNAAPGSALYQKARTGTNVNVSGTLFDILKQDVQNNTLPQVSWIVAPEAYSEHPNWPPNYGAWYVDQCLQVLTSNPELWSRTALLVTYDENDGFFDHMAPPFAPQTSANGLSTADITNEIFTGTGPAGTANNPVGPYGLGPRVPMILVSPWTKGGWVCSEVFDHTSIIRFIDKRFGGQYGLAKDTNITPWRYAISGDLTSAFNFKTPNEAMPRLPDTSAYKPMDMLRHPDYIPLVPVFQSVPKQEPGLRLARALPYEFSVVGNASAGDGRFKLSFKNTGNAGAGFLVYAIGSGNAPLSYTVEAGKSLSDHLTVAAGSSAKYGFSVFGPNGFLRVFEGTLASSSPRPTVLPEVEEQYDNIGCGLVLTFSNGGSKPCQFSIANLYDHGRPHTMTLEPGQRAIDVWDLRSSQGWYDITVTVPSDKGFVRRLAGHVENGQPSTSDPLLSPS